MKPKRFRFLLGGLALLFILFSLVILGIDSRTYRQQNLTYPDGTTIQGVPLGGLDRERALARLELTFTQPMELKYQGARMQFSPPELGFVLDLEATMDSLESSLVGTGYWSQLWSMQIQSAVDSPLQASLDETQLSAFLEATILSRYDQPASAALPVIGTTHFQPGQPGLALDINAAIPQIRTALFSFTERIVDLPLQKTPALPLDVHNFETFLKQIIHLEGFDGLVEIYLHDFSGAQNLHLAEMNGQSVLPDVAYTAASTIKIPIMLSVLSRTDEPTPQSMQNLLERMIIYSENPPADSLMSNYIDPLRGPLIVTEDLQSLGYENTFLAGYFSLGSPVLQLFKTPANTRTDIYLDPDVYNQTVPSEIGDLIAQIYLCANPQIGASHLSTVFAERVSQTECQNILDLLADNQIGLLIEAGLPPDTTAIHKHGWTPELDGLLHSMSDVSIVTTPGGDYALAIFIYTPDQLIFYEGNWLFAKLSQSIYNAFNIEDQTYWWLE